jgi:hypothetical protein
VPVESEDTGRRVGDTLTPCKAGERGRRGNGVCFGVLGVML